MPGPIKEAMFALLGWGGVLGMVACGVAFALQLRLGLGAIGRSVVVARQV